MSKIRNITKSLAVMEDLAVGSGTVQQERGEGKEVDLHIVVESAEALTSVDTSVYTRARVYSGARYTDYVYIAEEWQSLLDNSTLVLKIFQSPTEGGLTEIQTRTVNANEVYEVRKTSDDSSATIYSDATGTSEIVQNGTANKSGSDGVVKFYIAEGKFYVESGGIKSDFIIGLDASEVTCDDGLTAQDTHNAIKSTLKAHGLSGNFGFFASGLTYAEFGDIGIDSNGDMYQYNGSAELPFNVPQGTNPSNNNDFVKFDFSNYFPSFAGVEGLVGFEEKIINIFAGVDSLTDGAGGNGGRFGDSYINFVENSLRKKYGDAGVGWVSFDNRSTIREGMSFGRSANMQYIRGFEDKTVSPVIYSLDLGGLHSDSAVIGDYGIVGFAGDLSRDWDSCKVFYLQQPGGATIEIKQDGTTPVTADTSGALELQSVEIQADKGKSSQVRFDVTVAGACTVFGCFFTNSVTSGVMVSRLAYGGFQTAWFAGLDSAFQTQWLSELNPTHYLFNGGRNDISVPYTAEEFRDNADAYMSRFPATTEKLIFSPHASSTDFNGVIDGYRAIMRKYALDNGYGYIDNSKVLGTYENATERGWMLDETHASAKGNELIAANALKYMGANLEPWLQPKSFGGADSGEGAVLEGTLVPKTSTDLNQGVASTIMKINQLSGDAVVTALVTVRTGSGTGMIQSEHRFRLLGGSIVGSITSSETYRDGMTETYVVTLQAGTESDFELVMTPDAGNTNFLKACVTASYSVGSPVVTSGTQLFSVD